MTGSKTSTPQTNSVSPSTPFPSDETPNIVIRHRWVLLAGALLSFLYATNIGTWDIWWHLATGRWIMAHGAIPTTDSFSYTAKGEPWINVNWLGGLIYYGAWQLGNAAGVVILKVVIAFGILLFLGLAFRELGIDTSLTIAALVCFAVLLQPRFSIARPFAIGALMCSIAIYLGTRFTTRKDKSILFFIPVAWIWMNIHSSAVLTIPMLVLLAAIHEISHKGARRRRVLIPLAVVVLLFAGLTRGHELMRQVVAYDPTSLIVKYTAEWKPLTYHDRRVWVPWTLFAVAGIYGIRRFRRHPFSLGLLLMGVTLGTRFSRHLYVGVLLAAPLITLLFSDIGRILAAKGWRLARLALPCIMVLTVVGLHLAVEKSGALWTEFGFGITAHRYPTDTLAVLKTLPKKRTIHDFHLGGYLTFYNMPDGVFMDGRSVQVFREDHFKKLLDPLFHREGGLEIISDQFNITYGIGDLHDYFHEFFMVTPDWVPVYFGDASTLFVRKKDAQSLSDKGMPLFPKVRYFKNIDNMNIYYRALMSNPDKQSAFETEFLEAAALNPDSDTLTRILLYLFETAPQAALRLSRKLQADGSR